MDDKRIVSEKALRQLLALLDKKSKNDRSAIMRLWMQLVAEKQNTPRPSFV